MQKIGEAGYVLTSREFAFLAALTGAKNIYGIEDDTYTMSQDELKSEWNKVKSGLENKKYIEIEIDDSITIDEDLYELIINCCRPIKFIKCEGKGLGGKKVARNFYITRDIAIEVDEDRLMKKKYALTPMTSVEKVIHNLKECYDTDCKYEETEASWILPFEMYQELITYIENKEESKAYDILLGSSFEEEMIQDLYGALQKRDKYVLTSVLHFIPHAEAKLSSFSLFGGEKYLWKTDLVGTKGEDICLCITNGQGIEVEVNQLAIDIKNIYRRW